MVYTRERSNIKSKWGL